MKRKVGLFLLAVMVAVSLGAIIVTSLAMYRLASQRYAEEIRKIEASLSDRFAVFQAMLSDQHERITSHMEKVLPAIVAGAGGDGPGARRSLERRADGAGAAARRAAHLFHQSLARRLPDQPSRRHEPRLPQGLVHGVPRFGVRRQPGDERRHRPRRSRERSRPTATSDRRAKTTSSRPRPTSAAASTRPATAGWRDTSSTNC